MIGLNNDWVNSRFKYIINSTKKDIIEKIIDTNKDISTAIDNLNYSELKFKERTELLFFKNFSNIYNSTSYQNFINPLLELTQEKTQTKLLKFKLQTININYIINIIYSNLSIIFCIYL